MGAGPPSAAALNAFAPPPLEDHQPPPPVPDVDVKRKQLLEMMQRGGKKRSRTSIFDMRRSRPGAEPASPAAAPAAVSAVAAEVHEAGPPSPAQHLDVEADGQVQGGDDQALAAAAVVAVDNDMDGDGGDGVGGAGVPSEVVDLAQDVPAAATATAAASVPPSTAARGDVGSSNSPGVPSPHVVPAARPLQAPASHSTSHGTVPRTPSVAPAATPVSTDNSHLPSATGSVVYSDASLLVVTDTPRAKTASAEDDEVDVEPCDLAAIREEALQRKRQRVAESASAAAAAGLGGFSATAGVAVSAACAGDKVVKTAAETEFTRVLTKVRIDRGCWCCWGCFPLWTTFTSSLLPQEKFKQMRVLGQFNLGFIVTALGTDLFILDQHACDEKVQYETLQRTTTIHEQRLIR